MVVLNIVKAGVSLATSCGVGTIIGGAVKAVTPMPTQLVSKICIGIGTIALAGLAGSASAKYMEVKIDETVGTIKDAISSKSEEEEIKEEA